jgi:hypothetical protein
VTALGEAARWSPHDPLLAAAYARAAGAAAPGAEAGGAAAAAWLVVAERTADPTLRASSLASAGRHLAATEPAQAAEPLRAALELDPRRAAARAELEAVMEAIGGRC